MCDYQSNVKGYFVVNKHSDYNLRYRDVAGTKKFDNAVEKLGFSIPDVIELSTFYFGGLTKFQRILAYTV